MIGIWGIGPELTVCVRSVSLAFGASRKVDTLEETLLAIHILSAAAWIGAALFFGYAGPRFREVGGPAVAGWIQVALGSISRFLAPAAILTALSGVVLVLVEDEWGWGDGFVWIGLAVFVVALGIGLGWNVPNMRAALVALEDKDMPAVGAAMRKVALAGVVIVVLLFFAEFAMVFRLGSG
jgi:hypothetical protein